MKSSPNRSWTISPCWLRSLRDFMIPLATTWMLVAIFFLFLWTGLRTPPLDIFPILILTLTTILLTAGLIVIWRRCLYLTSNFAKWLNAQRGNVIRNEKQRIDALLGNLYIKAFFDRPSRDYKRLAGLHTEEKITQLLAEFPGIVYVDPPRNASHLGKYFLDYCARFMLRTSRVDLYWLARLEHIAGTTLRLRVDQSKVIVNVLESNTELESMVESAKDKLTVEGSLLEISVSPFWLRTRIIGGTWLGRVFEERIVEGIDFSQTLIELLGEQYRMLPLDQWTLNDNLEVVPITR